VVARYIAAGGFACADCGVNVLAIGHYYMLRREVWREGMPGIEGNLCLPCCERRLGRRLSPDDFVVEPEVMMWMITLPLGCCEQK
jgi:hypothetical protein